MIADQMDGIEGQSLQVGKIGEQRDQLEQQEGRERSGAARDQRHRRQQQQPRACGEIAQRVATVSRLGVSAFLRDCCHYGCAWPMRECEAVGAGMRNDRVRR